MTGWNHDLREPEYRKLDALASTDMKRLLDCAARFKHERSHPTEATEAMKLGSLLHCMVLTPQRLDEEWAVAPDVDRRTKEGKVEYADFIARSEGKEVVKAAVMDQARAMYAALRDNDVAWQTLNAPNAIYEVAGLLDDARGLTLKIRPDIRCESWQGGPGCIIDLKTTADAHPDRWPRQIVNLGYDVSAAFYLDVANAIDEGRHYYETFRWVVIETKEPYLSVVYSASYSALERGTKRYAAAIDRYLLCCKENRWPGYESKEIELPAWALKDA